MGIRWYRFPTQLAPTHCTVGLNQLLTARLPGGGWVSSGLHVFSQHSISLLRGSCFGPSVLGHPARWVLCAAASDGTAFGCARFLSGGHAGPKRPCSLPPRGLCVRPLPGMSVHVGAVLPAIPVSPSVHPQRPPPHLVPTSSHPALCFHGAQ